MSNRFVNFETVRKQLVRRFCLSALIEGILLTFGTILLASLADYRTDFPAGLSARSRWLILAAIVGISVVYWITVWRRFARFRAQAEQELVQFWETELNWREGELAAALDFDRRLNTKEDPGERRRPVGNYLDISSSSLIDPYLSSPELANQTVEQVLHSLETGLTPDLRQKTWNRFLPVRRLFREIAVAVLATILLFAAGPDWPTIQTALYRIACPESQILYPQNTTTLERNAQTESNSAADSNSAETAEYAEILAIRLRVTPPRAALSAPFNAPLTGTVLAESQIRFSVLAAGRFDAVWLHIQTSDGPERVLAVPYLGPGKEQTIPLKTTDQTENKSKVKKISANWYSVQILWPEPGDYWFSVTGNSRRNSSIDEEQGEPVPAPVLAQSDRWTIKTRPDLPPTVKLTGAGESTLEIVPEALVPWTAEATDDLGLLALSLRWRILAETEIATGQAPGRIIYQREPLFNAFTDETVKRPPKQYKTNKLWNPGSLELKPGAAVKIQVQAEDTARQESETPDILIKIVSREQINQILFDLRLRQESEIRRALQTLNRILQSVEKQELPNQTVQNQSLYREFARQVWNPQSGLESQLKSLVERVRMNHVNWGRTLTNLYAFISTLEQLDETQNKPILNLLNQFQNLETSPIAQERAIPKDSLQSQFQTRLTRIRDEFQSFSQSFVQWTRYRELAEQFRLIEKQVNEYLETETSDPTKQAEQQEEAGETLALPRITFDLLEKQLIEWRQQAAITHSGLAATRISDKSETKNLQSVNAALEQYAQYSPLKHLYNVRQTREHGNPVLVRAAENDFRASISRIAAILDAQGDAETQRRLLLKSDVEQLQREQAELYKETKKLFTVPFPNNPENASQPIWDRPRTLQVNALIDQQRDLAVKTGKLAQIPYPVLADSLAQAEQSMGEAANQLGEWLQIQNPDNPFSHEPGATAAPDTVLQPPIPNPTPNSDSQLLLALASQENAAELLDQLVVSLQEAERLTILALNRIDQEPNSNQESSQKVKEQKEDPTKEPTEEALSALAAKISIEDLKLLQISQDRLLNQTRLAYQSAIDQPDPADTADTSAPNAPAPSVQQTVLVNPATAAILAQRQQRLASLCWYLTTAATPENLLRGKRPESLPESRPEPQTENQTENQTTDGTSPMPPDISRLSSSKTGASLDDDLLGDLNEELPEPATFSANQSSTELSNSPANGKIANSSSDPAVQARLADQKKKQEEEKRFVETLWNQLGTAAVSEEDAPLLEIVRYMRQTFELFRLRDCGDINQGLQEQTCEHLEKLMNQLSFSKSETDTDGKPDKPQNQSSANVNDLAQKAPQENQPPKTEPADDPIDAETGAKSESNQSPDQSTPGSPDPQEKTQSGETQTLTPDQWRALQRRFWGELPQELQRSLMQLSAPVYPEEYKPAIDRYYQSILNTQDKNQIRPKRE